MLDVNNGLDGFFHSLIPRKLRETITIHEPAYIKVRALSALLFFSIVLQAMETTFVGTWHALNHQHLLKHELFSIGIFLVFILQATLFYKFSNYWLSALAFTSIYFLIIVIVIIISGGHHSPMKILLLTCPFMAFLIGDKQEGIQTSILVAVIGIMLAFLDFINFDTPNLFADTNPPVVFAIDWIITLAMTLFFLTVYESALEKDTSRMAHVRTRFLSVTLLVVAVLGTATVFPMIIGFWLFDNEVTRPSLIQNLIIVAVLLIFILQLWLFRRFANHSLSSLLFTNSYFLVVSAMVISSGGYDSLLKYFLLTCPLIAFVIGGMREGMQNGVYTAIFAVGLASLKMIGVEFPDFLIGSNHHPYLIFGTNWVVTLGIIMACIFVYETELQRTH